VRYPDGTGCLSGVDSTLTVSGDSLQLQENRDAEFKEAKNGGCEDIVFPSTFSYEAPFILQH